jgi:hypothetical protein
MYKDYLEREKFPTIKEWAEQFKDDDNTFGDCARDILDDRDFPNTRSHKTALKYIKNEHDPEPRILKVLERFFRHYASELHCFKFFNKEVTLFPTRQVPKEQVTDCPPLHNWQKAAERYAIFKSPPEPDKQGDK